MKAAGRSLRVTNAVARHASPLVGREGSGVVHAATATIDGLSMFAGQGAAQFRHWTGLDLPMDEARALLLQALGAPAP